MCVYIYIMSLNIIFLLDVHFEKSAIELYFLLIPFMLAKFQDDQRSITISPITCLNFKF